MRSPRFLSKLLCAVVLTSSTAGCYHSGSSSASDPAQNEFVPAFLTAHDKKDLDAEKKLVDWDDVTETSRDHFRGELKSALSDNTGSRIRW